MKCRIKKHMTVATLEGQKTLIFNYSCMPHGILRLAFRDAEKRSDSITEHLAKKKHKSSNLP